MSRKVWSFFSLALFPLLISGCGQSTIVNPEKAEQQAAYYSEKYRPQYHFSPDSGWMNDPNGLAFLDGKYHMFYQYYPDSTVWGPMHWGHAVSTDLIHWKHLPVALFPDSLGYIFSGSSVADKNNTSGLGAQGKIPLIAIFTIHNPVAERSGSNTFENQGMAYSLDNGRSWTKYPGNPVLKNPGIRDFRDPKVVWFEKTKKWIMILAVHDRVHLYSSPNLKEWTFESEFGENKGAHGGVWECPDLFPLKVSGTDLTKWVMLVSINPGGPNGGSATQYFTGEFDGHKFSPDDTKVNWVDYGPDNYAGVTWSNIPESDGRRLFIGWMSNWNYATSVPASSWRSAMTLPRELSLLPVNDQYLLISQPVHEINNTGNKSDSIVLSHQNFSGEKVIPLNNIRLNQSELSFEFGFDMNSTDTVNVILENSTGERVICGYSFLKKNIFIDRRGTGNTSFSKAFPMVATAPYIPRSTLKMQLFIDASSVEMFIDDGKLIMTSLFFPAEEFTSLKINAGQGKVSIAKAVFYGIKSIWH